MFALTISFGPGPVVWTLLFKTEETAKIAVTATKIEDSPTVDVVDDFGQELSIIAADIHGIMLEDLEQSKLAHIERHLHNQRTQVLANRMTETDQVLRTERGRQGPSILTPMGMNGGRN